MSKLDQVIDDALYAMRETQHRVKKRIDGGGLRILPNPFILIRFITK